MLPKISIVTPSYNQGQYLEDTILSVLGQNYPNLEYIIMDGGSTDNSVDIIKKHQHRLTYWLSEPDGGQSGAINKGFDMATGAILMWLNSDDLLMPNVLSYIAGITDITIPEIRIGNCLHFKEEETGQLIGWGSDVVKSDKDFDLNDLDFIIQPSSFWTKKAWEKNGRLNEQMHYTFDWEWFIRAKKNDIPIIPTSKCLSLYRYHNAHKSSSGGTKRQQEISKIFQSYNPRIASLYQLLLSENFKLISRYQAKLRSLPFKLSFTVSDGFLLKKLRCTRYKRFSAEEINRGIKML